MNRLKIAALAVTLCGLSGLASAGAFTTNNPTGAAGTSVNLIVRFAGEGETTDSQWDAGVAPPGNLTFSAPVAIVAGSSCVILGGGTGFRVSPPSGGAVPLTSTVTDYCSFTVAIAAAAANGTRNFTNVFLECADPLPSFNVCTASGSVTVGVPAGTAPTVGPLAATTLSAGAVGGTAAGDVVVTVATAGTAPGSLALACTIPASAPSNFLITAGANRTINAPAALGANAPPISVSCVRQATATTSTLTCAQTATPGPNPAALTAVITCPAGTAADVSPNLTYNPPSGGALTLTAAGANGTGAIAITPAGGTGAATTTVGSCAFAANTASFASTPATLTFTGPTTTAQNLNLTCVRQAAAVTALLTCQENQSDGTPAGNQPRTFNITCPAAAPVVTPEFNSTPPAGTTISLNGTQGGAAPTSQVSVTNSEPATTLIVSAAVTGAGLSVTPAGPVNIVPGTPQVFTVTCSTATVGTFSGTLTFTTNDPDDGEGTVTFPVTCSIIAGGGGTQATAVPTLSPAGKLIAIFSVLGLGLLGFAVTRRA